VKKKKSIRIWRGSVEVGDDQVDRATKCSPSKEDIAVVMLMKELLSAVQWFDR
jgi:hypothetical protein